MNNGKNKNKKLSAYGLHNLKPVEKQMSRMMHDGLNALFQTVSQPWEIAAGVTGVVQAVYGKHAPDKKYNIQYAAVVPPNAAQVLCAPLNLTSHILLQGKDIPPNNLPDYGEWASPTMFYSCIDSFTTYAGYEST